MAYAPFYSDVASEALKKKKKAAAVPPSVTTPTLPGWGPPPPVNLPPDFKPGPPETFTGYVPGFSEGAPPPAFDPYNLDQAFEVQLGKASAARTRKDAYAETVSALEQALLGYGSESLARSTLEPYRGNYEATLGHPLDLGGYYSSFAGATDPNTGFSTLAQRARSGQASNRTLSNQLAANRLVYSSTGANQRNDLAYQQQLQGVQDLQSLQEKLSGASTGLAASLRAAQDTEDTGMLNAQNRLFQAALANPSAYANSAPVSTNAPVPSFTDFVQQQQQPPPSAAASPPPASRPFHITGAVADDAPPQAPAASPNLQEFASQPSNIPPPPVAPPPLNMPFRNIRAVADDALPPVPSPAPAPPAPVYAPFAAPTPQQPVMPQPPVMGQPAQPPPVPQPVYAPFRSVRSVMA